MVLDDVKNGLLTPEAARDDNGVTADAGETARLREAPRPKAGAFTLGPVRTATEARWPTEASRAVAAAALEAPSGIRTHLLHSLRTELEKKLGPVTVADVVAAAARHNAGG